MDFENLINKAEFTPVASRAAQAATLKAEKLGVKTVDLEAAKKKKPSSSENGGNTPSGGNTPTGGNTPSGGNTPAGSENSGTEGTEGTGEGE